MTIIHKRTKQFEKYVKKPFEFRKAAFITKVEKKIHLSGLHKLRNFTVLCYSFLRVYEVCCQLKESSN